MAFWLYITIVICFSHIALTTFDINDDTLFNINWGEFNPLEMKMDDGAKLAGPPLNYDQKDVVVLRSSDNEEYECFLPSKTLTKFEQGNVDTYHGPSELQLLKPLFQQIACSYKMESYWTYELCHGRHLRQYHEEKTANKPVHLQEYYLGNYDGPQISDLPDPTSATPQTPSTPATVKTEEESKIPKKEVAKPPTITLEGVTYPYFQVNYTGGTPCDLKSNEPRSTSIFYICHTEGRGELYEITETQSCEYRVVVLSKLLCEHPAYRQRQAHVNKIQCKPRKGAASKPVKMTEIETDKRKDLKSQLDNLEALFGTETEVVVKQQGHKIFVQVRKKGGDPIENVDQKVLVQSGEDKDAGTAGAAAAGGEAGPGKMSGAASEQSPPLVYTPTGASSLLKQFISGEYCIVGGTGWWRHELCFKKYARQFHDDPKSSKRTIVNLGQWHEVAHLEWVRIHPKYRPSMPAESRMDLWHYYESGDICDLTGKPRVTRVHIKCLPTTSASISIMLTEPEPCQYTLTVEAALLCPLVRAANLDGIVSEVDLEKLMSEGVSSTSQPQPEPIVESNIERGDKLIDSKEKLDNVVQKVAKEMEARINKIKKIVKKSVKKTETVDSDELTDAEIAEALKEAEEDHDITGGHFDGATTTEGDESEDIPPSSSKPSP